MAIGPIAIAAIDDPGSGYAIGDTGILGQGTNQSGRFQVTGVSAGQITTFTVTDPGDNYDTEGTLGFTITLTGGGSGFTWFPVAVSPGTGGGGQANAFH